MIRCLSLMLVGLFGSAEVYAQAIQQPVVDVFSVDTVVSVPDRGSAHLGGVRQGAYGRNTAGPFQSGTAWGAASSASSASTHVWIHDFEAMDAALLAEGRPTAPSAPPTRADLARAHLAREHAASIGRVPPPVGMAKVSATARPPLRPGPALSPSPSRGPLVPRSSAASPTVQPLQYNLIR